MITKKKLLIVSIFLSILQLLYLFLLYFQLIRYFKIKYNITSIDNYINNYKDVDKIDKKIVISFNTSNITNLDPMLKSILDQSLRVDKIVLNTTKNINLPNKYKKFLNIYKVDNSLGPATSIIPSLLREVDKDTHIIFIKDNIIYNKYFIENLIDESDKFPKNVISCKQGFLVKPNFFNKEIINYDKNNISSEWIIDNLNCKIKNINILNYRS